MLLKNLHGDGKNLYSFDVSLIRPPNDEGLWLNVAEVLATRFIMFNQAAAIRRKPLEKLGGFDTSLKYLEDYDLPMRLAFEGPWAYIRDPLATWAGGGSDSFAKRAADDASILNDCRLRIFERTLAVAQERSDAKAEKHILRGISFCRREVKATQIRQSGSRFERGLDVLRGKFLHCYYAALRRSPLFPKMRSVKIQEPVRGFPITGLTAAGAAQLPVKQQ
jgi:hypothetical protein